VRNAAGGSYETRERYGGAAWATDPRVCGGRSATATSGVWYPPLLEPAESSGLDKSAALATEEQSE
jgi:hypothetical protein